MADPPELWGWTPKLMDAPDPRWLAVKDEQCPAVSLLGGRDNPIHVDQYVNDRITYRPDIADVWFEPWRTYRSGSADCEDFAILKRAILITNGFPENRIWFLLVMDALARCDHAVLLVYDDRWRILDCRKCLAGGALPVEQVSDFTPRRAMQGEQQWTFERRRAII